MLDNFAILDHACECGLDDSDCHNSYIYFDFSPILKSFVSVQLPFMGFFDIKFSLYD